MADMLVKLYALPDVSPVLARLRTDGVEVRLAAPSEKHIVAGWVRRHFWDTPWAAECEAAIEQRPVRCFLAVTTGGAAPGPGPYDLPPQHLLGFACFDTTHKGLFGPTGVREGYRGRGIGSALLLTCLHTMRLEGYAYAVIGWAGPTAFYARVVGATVIEGSEPGPFRGPLRDEP